MCVKDGVKGSFPLTIYSFINYLKFVCNVKELVIQLSSLFFRECITIVSILYDAFLMYSFDLKFLFI